ncbi:Uncharacterised protein [Staphylococcus microti]|uniref:Uncharacterized protein n=1 Tax=Staphylococcus microti TaxID=569857 RepID=A0A380GQL9_9STAP|nr:Uncharacterised protein [Staphylococcus microti]
MYKRIAEERAQESQYEEDDEILDYTSEDEMDE